MRAGLTAPPSRMALSRLLALVVGLLALGAAFDLATANGWFSSLRTGPAPAYAQQLAAIEQRYAVSIAQLNGLLTTRDANPTLVESPSWQQQFGKVGNDLAAEYRDLQALHPSPSSAGRQTCLESAYRLTAEGTNLLAQGFQIDGHGAYYFGSHGNWDLNLGQQQLRQCGSP